jgi:hypothetical protein
MCENCNENNYQQVHICSEEQVPCSCPVKDLSTDCVNFDQEDLKYDATTVVPKNTLLTVALDNILQFLKVKIEEIQNYFKVVNTGLGSKIYSGNTLLGEKKLRSLTSSDNSVDIVETANEIDITVQAIVPDGSETKLQNGTNTTVNGVGTIASPYTVNVTLPTPPDGSETKLQAGTNVTISGNGTTVTPYVINSSGTTPVDNRVFEKIDEGNGEGIVIRNRFAGNYGNIGLAAIDFSTSSSSSSVLGATGAYSFAIGRNVRASGFDAIAIAGAFSETISAKATGDGSIAIGRNTISSGNDSCAISGGAAITTASSNNTMALHGGTASASSAFAIGIGVTGGLSIPGSSLASGNYSAVIGLGESSGEYSKSISLLGNAKSFAETIMGTYPDDSPAPLSTNSFNPLDKLFSIGNGSSGVLKSNALTILKNGTITTPSLTINLIDTASEKVLVTKEYLSRQREITSSTTIANSDNGQTIFINNGATPITITINTTVTTANFGVGFIQEGIGDVTFVGTGVSLTNPIGLKSKGQGYATYIERKLNTSSFFLLGDTKA